MSDFTLAIPSVLRHEGGFIDNPLDPGGATQFGISLRFLQHLTGNASFADIRNLSQADAIKIYEQEWWERNHYAAIISQEVATKILDLAVNMGSHQAHICVQRALRAATKNCLIEDGIIGNQTLHLLNSTQPELILAALKSEAAGFYRSLRQPQFEKGWLMRAYD